VNIVAKSVDHGLNVLLSWCFIKPYGHSAYCDNNNDDDIDNTVQEKTADHNLNYNRKRKTSDVVDVFHAERLFPVERPDDIGDKYVNGKLIHGNRKPNAMNNTLVGYLAMMTVVRGVIASRFILF